MNSLAYSKLNLYLKVTQKRSDGYHNLHSLFWPLSTPADIVTLEEATTFSLNSSEPTLPINGENLAGKAALLYAQKAEIDAPWNIYIDKHIPIAAGMGGGSADAAAVLTLLNQRYDSFSKQELSELALQLGADVPFFLNPKAGMVTGVGEILSPFEFEVPELPLVIVAPKFPVSAKWAFTHLNPKYIGDSDANKVADLIAGVESGDLEKIAKNLHNDLAFALYEKFPILGMLKTFMVNNGALNAEITGSGPVIYGIASDIKARENLAQKLQEEYSTAIDVIL